MTIWQNTSLANSVGESGSRRYDLNIDISEGGLDEFIC